MKKTTTNETQGREKALLGKIGLEFYSQTIDHTGEVVEPASVRIKVADRNRSGRIQYLTSPCTSLSELKHYIEDLQLELGELCSGAAAFLTSAEQNKLSPHVVYGDDKPVKRKRKPRS